MYRHFFWCAFGKISIAAVALLAQCTKCSVACRNSRQTFYDATYEFLPLNSVIEQCSSTFLSSWNPWYAFAFVMEPPL